jgi:hypothetical protein
VLTARGLGVASGIDTNQGRATVADKGVEIDRNVEQTKKRLLLGARSIVKRVAAYRAANIVALVFHGCVDDGGLNVGAVDAATARESEGGRGEGDDGSERRETGDHCERV